MADNVGIVENLWGANKDNVIWMEEIIWKLREQAVENLLTMMRTGICWGVKSLCTGKSIEINATAASSEMEVVSNFAHQMQKCAFAQRYLSRQHSKYGDILVSPSNIEDLLQDFQLSKKLNGCRLLLENIFPVLEIS